MVVICLLLVIILVVAFVALFAYKPLQDLFQTSKSEKLKAFVSTFFASLTFAWLAIFANRLCTMSQDNLWSNLVGLFLATVVITLVVMLAWWNTKKWLCQYSCNEMCWRAAFSKEEVALFSQLVILFMIILTYFFNFSMVLPLFAGMFFKKLPLFAGMFFEKLPLFAGINLIFHFGTDLK